MSCSFDVECKAIHLIQTLGVNEEGQKGIHMYAHNNRDKLVYEFGFEPTDEKASANIVPIFCDGKHTLFAFFTNHKEINEESKDDNE